MKTSDEAGMVSIRYTLTLEDGTLLSQNVAGNRLEVTRGEGQVAALIEQALQGAVIGEKRVIVLSPEHDPHLKLDVSRLALLVGHPGETLVLTVESL